MIAASRGRPVRVHALRMPWGCPLAPQPLHLLRDRVKRWVDVQHCHGVVGQMSHAQRATVLKRDYTPGQLVSLLGHFKFTVGMRLHFLIFSALAGLPFMALPYATKVTGFLEELQILTPALDDVSAGQLIANIDRAWDRRDELRGQVQAALKELQARARLNNDIAIRMLEQSSGRRGRGSPQRLQPDA